MTNKHCSVKLVKKRCKRCRRHLPLTSFRLLRSREKGNANRRRSDTCYSCLRLNTRLKSFGIDVEDYERIVRRDGRKCGICRAANNGSKHRKREMNIDHVTTEDGEVHVRGILCDACNTALGLLREDLVNLARAVKYAYTRGPELTPQEKDRARFLLSELLKIAQSSQENN